MGSEKADIERRKPDVSKEPEKAGDTPLPTPEYKAQVDQISVAMLNFAKQKFADLAKVKPNPEEQDELGDEAAKTQLDIVEAQTMTLTQVDLAKSAITDAVLARLKAIASGNRGGVGFALGDVGLSTSINDNKDGPLYGVSAAYKGFSLGVKNIKGDEQLVFNYSLYGEKLDVSYSGTMSLVDLSSSKNTLDASLKLKDNVSLMASVALDTAADKKDGITIKNYEAGLGVKFGPATTRVSVRKTPTEFISTINLNLTL